LCAMTRTGSFSRLRPPPTAAPVFARPDHH
jgi:hypothetical protein